MGKPMSYTDGPDEMLVQSRDGVRRLRRDVIYDVPGAHVPYLRAAGLEHDDREAVREPLPEAD